MIQILKYLNPQNGSRYVMRDLQFRGRVFRKQAYFSNMNL
jgi:hypothetical protein